MKIKTRIIAFAFTALILCMQLTSFVALAGEIDADTVEIYRMYYHGQSVEVTNLQRSKNVDIGVTYSHDNSDGAYQFDLYEKGKTVSIKTSDIKIGGGFKKNTDTKMSIMLVAYDPVSKIADLNIFIEKVQYTANSDKLVISEIIVSNIYGTADNYKFSFNAEIPTRYFADPIPPVTGDDDELFSSDIIVENTQARTKDRDVIAEVSKETEPFTLEVVFSDRGLRDVDVDEFTDDTMYVYITDAGDFIPTGSTRGTLTRAATPTGDPPRFRASFPDLKYAGTSANAATLTFRVQYDIYGQDVKGEGKAMLYAIVPEEEDDDEDEIAPPTPYIIISQYDLGAEQIEAGSKFNLSFSFRNTSKDVPLENIRLTVNPVTIGTTESSFLSIASATNTYYFENLTASGSLSQQVEILVKGNATVGSQALSIEFTYEYLVDKARKSGSTETTIYIPITQIDRFQVDPLTDFSSWMTLGEEGYATISFVNHGKSTTYNVSGYILDAQGNQGQTEHYGNLDAGAYGTLDFTLIPSEIGDYNGTIIIRYENENGDENEIETTFTAYVEEPWSPPVNPGPIDPGMVEPEQTDSNMLQWILFAVGGLAIAIPLALYIAKRIKLKGSEDFDEDF